MTSLRLSGAGCLAVVLAIGLGSGCERHSESGSSNAADARTYTVRGVIRQLPSTPGVPLLIEHEAIPDFTDMHGNLAPMAAMTMPFSLADETLLDSLAVGDTVRFEIVVDWSAASAIVIDSIQTLPATTPLDLGKPDARSSP